MKKLWQNKFEKSDLLVQGHIKVKGLLKSSNMLVKS